MAAAAMRGGTTAIFILREYMVHLMSDTDAIVEMSFEAL